MTTQRKTARLPDELAARLRRAAYLAKHSESDITVEALDHWLANPRRPGCWRCTVPGCACQMAPGHVASQAAP